MNLIVLIGIVPLILGILALVIFLNYRSANKLENSVLSSVSGPFAMITILRRKRHHQILCLCGQEKI